ncbi:MAG: S9 family peptidase [Bacteroidales bacterium]|nr:MAG: S9 family peptidase [Bacteroidales bacterium]
MKKIPYSFSFICMAVILSSCSTKVTENHNWVKFKSREIDLTPYFEGFPYSGFTPFYKAGKLFYYHQDTITMLKQVDLDGHLDLESGTLISDIDFSTRNVWGMEFRKQDGSLYWLGDEENDEVINLFRLDPDNGEIKKLTDVPYIFGARWNREQSKVAFIARLGDKENRLGELRVLDLSNMEEELIIRDNPDYRFTWTDVSWQPEGKGVVCAVLKNADRTYGNLVYVDFSSGEWILLTDLGKPRSFPAPYKEWLNNEEFVYLSNENGFLNLYSCNIRTAESKMLTNFDMDLSPFEMITIDGEKYIFAIVSNPIENEMFLIDSETGEIVNQQKIDINLGIYDSEGNRLLVSGTSASQFFRIDELEVTLNRFSFVSILDLPGEYKNQIIHSKVEKIEYPTFDLDPETGEPRMLHAFLYHPVNPLPSGEDMVMIESFYGGGNYFSTQIQILAEAGIYVLSPSPRGSNGFGREFSSLNDKDLGGNEIIDIIYAGEYISNELGIPPSRIGVFGASHGGYATMRLLTFPGEVNGIKAHFDWGFGISHAGFSDIIHFYQHCNIPDWVILEAGDPVTEQDKLNDRSPIFHAGKATGKLLLTHGTNDSRVPIEGSRQMADSLAKYDKEFNLVEFEGQGHGIKGLQNQKRRYKTWFDFLETVR